MMTSSCTLWTVSTRNGRWESPTRLADALNSSPEVVNDVLTFETEVSQKKDGTQNMKAKNVTGGTGGTHVPKGGFGPVLSGAAMGAAAFAGPYGGLKQSSTIPPAGADGRYHGVMKASK